MNDNKKKKLHIPVELVISLVLVVIIIGGVLFAYKWDSDKRESVAGTYSCEFKLNGSNTNTMMVYYKFDAQKGTYEELWGERTLMTGTYTLDDNRITMVSDGNEELGAESETEYFIVYEDRIFPENYIYNGEIPQGNTFDAVCTLTDNAGQIYKVTFASDGTYTYLIGAEDNPDMVEGTYERDGDFIHHTNEEGNELNDFYIYENRLVGLVYTKETE